MQANVGCRLRRLVAAGFGFGDDIDWPAAMRPTYSPMMPSTINWAAPSNATADISDVQPTTVWSIHRKLTIE